jgi:hypothetical protein
MGDLMSTIKANDLQSASGGIPTVKGQQLISTAWVNFDGTGTVAIRDSENVSSITDNGTGDYSVNFTTNMSDINYSAVGSGGTSGSSVLFDLRGVSNFAVGSFKLITRNSSGSNVDADVVCATVLGGQA